MIVSVKVVARLLDIGLMDIGKNEVVQTIRRENINIEETIEYLESSGGVIIFWILWILLTCGCVFGFYYIDNEWLE